MRLFSDFFQSDIVVASPLALATKLGEEGQEGATTADFLSSIEVLVMDRADVLQMQNWSHVSTGETDNIVADSTRGARHARETWLCRNWPVADRCLFVCVLRCKLHCCTLCLLCSLNQVPKDQYGVNIRRRREVAAAHTVNLYPHLHRCMLCSLRSAQPGACGPAWRGHHARSRVCAVWTGQTLPPDHPAQLVCERRDERAVQPHLCQPCGQGPAAPSIQGDT